MAEEVDETQFWFDYLSRIHLIGKEENDKVFKEVNELVRLFTSIKSKMKAKLQE